MTRDIGVAAALCIPEGKARARFSAGFPAVVFNVVIGDWGLGIGDSGFGIGDLGIRD
jgi:hypothetical protein